MAKLVESSSEPSQSSSALPPLVENEVELVIDRFWRDTRPRVCVRSETKMVNGFNFRLLVWPQGSKQSQSHLSAFVEVVPPTGTVGSDGKTVSGAYPLDWACPCVFYRISVMNFKQKYPYSKADTWTFSYVCSDRGWHTLLDTRYINRRDGYLSNDGSLVIRAIAFPRFAHSISVLPLLNSVSHEGLDSEDVYPSPHPRPKFGLSNFLATDHLNCLIQSLFHLPGFRKFIYTQFSPPAISVPALDEATLASIESGLDSCIDTIKEIMGRIEASSVDVYGLIIADFYRDVCQMEPSTSALIRKYAKCRVLINCIEEALFCVSSSLGRKRIDFVVNHKRTQLEAYQQIVKDCRRILTSVCHSLFLTNAAASSVSGNLIEELQLVFAQLEFASDATLIPALLNGRVKSGLIDTRGLIRELGMANGGITSCVSPDGLYLVFFEALRKAFRKFGPSEETKLAEFVSGLANTSEGTSYSFTQVRFSSRSTSIEKHLNCWSGLEQDAPTQGGSTVHHHREDNNALTELSGLAQESTRFAKVGKILNFQFLNRVKDRMDVTERIELGPYYTPSDEAEVIEEEDFFGIPEKFDWEIFLRNNEPVVNTLKKDISSSSCKSYRLHSLLFCSGDLTTGHYSVLVRHNRAGGWTRFDDAWKEEMIDAFDGEANLTRPNWVFSPEWSLAGATYVREDAIDELYFRGVDVRLLRPDIFEKAVNLLVENLTLLPIDTGLVCNRVSPPESVHASALASPSPPLDSSYQVEVCLITEKAILAASPGGFSVPFSLAFPNVPRKLIVRKDIPVSRLMKAVADHFKIPTEMQRLFALRYYGETCQERFELMAPHRSILAHLPDAKSSLGKLYVLVSAATRGNRNAMVTVWVKVLDEERKALLSVCLLTVDSESCLKDHFETVAAKAAGIVGSNRTDFLVFEEVGPRLVEIRKCVNSTIANEGIVDGDILIFVPLTDSAKKSLVTSSLSNLVKRNVVPHVPAPPPQVAERCRRFLSQVEEEEEDRLEMIEMLEEECFCCECGKEHGSEESRAETIRKLLRAAKQCPEKPSERLHEVMNDIIKEFEEGGLSSAGGQPLSAEELEESEKYFSKLIASNSKRLDLPVEIRDEISRIPCPMCFYCRLPTTSSRSSVPARVGCSRRCVAHALLYHERCVQDLIRENGGSDACIITENCPGRLLVEPKSVAKKEAPKTTMSSAVLRAKVAEVLPVPQMPVLNKAGIAAFSNGELVVWKPTKRIPVLPSIPAMKKPKKNGLPAESLWWNACVVAFGDNLTSVVTDRQWDAADLALAKSIFANWCRGLIEKKKPKEKVVAKEVAKPASSVTKSKKKIVVKSPIVETSCDEEVTPEPPRVVQPTELMEEEYYMSSDSESVWEAVVSKKDRKDHISMTVVPTPTSNATTSPTNLTTPTTLTMTPIHKTSPKAATLTPPPGLTVQFDASIVAERAISSILLDEEINTPSITPQQSVVATALPENARMALLPATIRTYCLPMEIVFVYYSEDYFRSNPVLRDTKPLTVSLITETGQDCGMHAIYTAAFNSSCAIARLFASPNQGASVQWFAEFHSIEHCEKFFKWTAIHRPEWTPETGALLPASLLGFAV